MSRAVSVFLAMCVAAICHADPSPSPAPPPVPVYSLARRTQLAAAWFRDVLGRPGGPAEHAQWAEQGLHYAPYALASHFVHTPEAQAAAYRELALRVMPVAPEAAIQAFVGGAPGRHFVRRDARAEIAGLPGLVPAPETPAARAGALHRLVLGRAATRAEAESWGLVIARGLAPAGVCFQLERSDAGVVARAQALWTRYLGRALSDQETQHVLASTHAGATEEDLLAALLGGPEYAARRGIPAQ